MAATVKNPLIAVPTKRPALSYEYRPGRLTMLPIVFSPLNSLLNCLLLRMKAVKIITTSVGKIRMRITNVRSE